MVLTVDIYCKVHDFHVNKNLESVSQLYHKCQFKEQDLILDYYIVAISGP